MDSEYLQEHQIGYFQVDREQRIRLGSLFQLLQEAAVQHYNLLIQEKGEEEKSWFLGRLAMRFKRYPKFGETIQVETWISSFSGFKAFREFRILCDGKEIGEASAVWLYVDLGKKRVAKVPEEIVESIPVRNHDCFFSDLVRMILLRTTEGAARTSISLRYADYDPHQHVNSAAYLDFLQTGLSVQKKNTRPRELVIHFTKEIGLSEEAVEVALEEGEQGLAFRIGFAEEMASYGQLRFD
ncbi:acyl-[acyl-carrier-protein] thioesterase [Pelagicoccus mobilis]|uniref:Acyl-ACP thioesterase n=1 Tax=Pelagicoccus mobilis TaxID=415221 RepID=A0A934RY83_9BACT|nr:acyl-ACP thioesterase domain-containing protein [Pelagicoccus mobilis]MBK1877439.1 hypothetical protein [Pelagicoccus mobilis]